MVHCGYEATAVDDTFGSWSGFARTVKLTLLGLRASKPVGANGSQALPSQRMKMGAIQTNGANPESITSSATRPHQGCGSGACSHHDQEEELETTGKSS
jgi:hypothetical protein